MKRKKGDVIAAIRRFARTGKTFSKHSFAFAPETVVGVFKGLRLRGEIAVVKKARAPFMPAIWKATPALAAVDTFHPGEWRRTHPPTPRPEPGEIYIGQWIIQEAARAGVHPKTISRWLKMERYNGVVVRRPTQRSVFIKQE